MVRRNVVIPDDLDNRFRAAVSQRKGVGKGNLSDAVVEAIELWLRHGAEAQKSAREPKTLKLKK